MYNMKNDILDVRINKTMQGKVNKIENMQG